MRKEERRARKQGGHRAAVALERRDGQPAPPWEVAASVLNEPTGTEVTQTNPHLLPNPFPLLLASISTVNREGCQRFPC